MHTVCTLWDSKSRRKENGQRIYRLTWCLWSRGQDLNLRPPGYEVALCPSSRGVLEINAQRSCECPPGLKLPQAPRSGQRPGRRPRASRCPSSRGCPARKPPRPGCGPLCRLYRDATPRRRRRPLAVRRGVREADAMRSRRGPCSRTPTRPCALIPMGSFGPLQAWQPIVAMAVYAIVIYPLNHLSGTNFAFCATPLPAPLSCPWNTRSEIPATSSPLSPSSPSSSSRSSSGAKSWNDATQGARASETAIVYTNSF